MKKKLVLFLAMVLLIGLFAGCSGNTAATEPAAEPQAQPAEAQTDTAAAQTAPAQIESQLPVTEEPDSPETEEPVASAEPEAAPPAQSEMPEVSASQEPEQPSSQEAAPETAFGPAFQIDYPLDAEGETITLWNNSPSQTIAYNSFNEMPIVPLIVESTGVNWQIVEVSATIMSEQFNLMVAAGDMCDLIPAGSLYSGGEAQAFADDVIIDIQPYVDDYMPDYAWYISQQDSGTLENMYTSNGEMLQFYTIADGPGYINNIGSLTTRGDWLEEMGFDYGEVFTFDEYDKLIHDFHDLYGCEYTLNVGTSGSISGLEWAFDIRPASLNADASSIGQYIDDGRVKSPYVADNYRDYLEWFIGLYNDGIVSNEFFISDLDMSLQFSYEGNGNIAVWGSAADKYDEIYRFTENPNFKLAALPDPRPSENATVNPWFNEVNLASGTFSATTDCDHVELLCQWQNFFFTEPGIMYCNYGIEGDLYTVDEAGNISWTEAVTNPQQLPNAEVVIRTYAFNSLCAFYEISEKLVPTFTDEVREALDIWQMDGTSDHAYPSGAALTSAEQDSVTDQITDICTIAAEELLRFVTGSKELNGENWTAYVDRLEGLGLNDVLEVYQAAYDEYLAGER